MTFDFNKEISAFLTKNSFLFTDRYIPSDVYVEHFVNEEKCIYGGSPFCYIDAQKFIDDYKTTIVQTYQNVTPNGGLVFSSLFQLSPEEHVHMTFQSFEDKIVFAPYFRLKNNALFPTWLETLSKYRVDEKDKQLGFAHLH